MKKVFWIVIIILGFASLYIILYKPEYLLVGLPTQYDRQSKDYGSTVPGNPTRPSFDLWGNEFDYQGNLINTTSCTIDPISLQPNPYSCNVAQPTYESK